MIRIVELNFLTRMQICLIIFLHLFSAVQPMLFVDKRLLSLSNVLVDVPLGFLLNQKHSPTVSKTFKKEYDYIVVGAGSAGSVVASRLSEIPCVNVLLLEAGGPPPLLTEIPIGALATWFTEVDWKFRTVPQRHTGRGLVNRESVLLDFGISAAELKRLCHEIEDASVPPSKKSRSDVSTIDRPSIPQPAPSGIHLKDLKKSLNCPLCELKFQRKNHLLRHMRWHESHAASSSESSMEISEDEARPEVRTVECQPQEIQSNDNEVHPEMTTSKERSELTGASTHEFVLPRGKMLGGSSSMNNLLYVRGNRNNYDGWADQGAKGWSYKDVLPYFKKLEDNRDPEFLENGYHNKSGPVTVERPKYEPLLKKTYYEALKSFGFDFLDPNAERQTGIYDIQGNTRDGQRCGTAKAYLVPAENRENLDIITNAMVKKVLIDKHRAVGVEFDFGGQTYQVKANREVIVSAGSIKTPQLLMLSGLGPTEELSKFNISVISDLPVGKNYHDHAATLMLYKLGLKNPSVAVKSSNPESLVKYFKNRSGPLASLTYLYYLGWFRGNTTSSTIDKPNYELYFGEVTTSIIAAPFFDLRPEIYEAYLGPYFLEPLLMCLVQQTQPRSKGSVTLKSTSIYDQPLIDPNYLSDVRDEDDMIQGMQMCEKVALSKPLRSLGSRPLKTFIPGCEKYASDEVKYFRCQLRTVLISAHHSVGSVKMGDPSDPTTVLDPKLRVKTIKGLRVVDGSVMPLITSGNTNIPIIMIAEKASDMIKETINCQSKDIVTET